MTKEKALRIVLAAAKRLAAYCSKGSTICFDSDSDEEYGKKVCEALEVLEQAAVEEGRGEA